MHGTSTTIAWPAGKADRVFLVLDEADAVRLAPVLADRPKEVSPVSAAIGSLDISIEDVARELVDAAATDIWLVLPRTAEARDFYHRLSQSLIDIEEAPPALALIPDGIELGDILDHLTAKDDRDQRSLLDAFSSYLPPSDPCGAFMRVIQALWLATCPPDEWLGPYVLQVAANRRL